MPRITSKLIVMILCVLFIIFYCEYLIYYAVIAQCGWLPLAKPFAPVLKALILSDPHLVNPNKAELESRRLDWQMYQAFRAIVTLHKPDVVFVLGDLFDDGLKVKDPEFKAYAERFYAVFPVPENIEMHVLVGNHDIGFHGQITRARKKLFTRLFNATSVQLLTIKENHFVLLNSMAMHGDVCAMCKEARREIERIADMFGCSEDRDDCTTITQQSFSSKPILLQHFPMYRYSEEVCQEPDSPPPLLKQKKNRQKMDSLSVSATDYLVAKLRPRLVIGGHTHYGCKLYHKYKTAEFWEYSVPSFTWRNIADPKYMLVTISPEEYAINKCGLPKQTSIFVTAVLMMAAVVYVINRRIFERRIVNKITNY